MRHEVQAVSMGWEAALVGAMTAQQRVEAAMGPACICNQY